MSAVKTRIMYIQHGRRAGRIGRVRLSKTGRTHYYGELVLESLAGRGHKANYIDLSTNETYWVSGAMCGMSLVAATRPSVRSACTAITLLGETSGEGAVHDSR